MEPISQGPGAERQLPGCGRRRWLLAVLALAAALRLAAALWLPADPLPDTATYERLAAGLGERGELCIGGNARAAVVPGYPVFIAGCRAIFGKSDLAWRIPQALLGLATVLGISLLARRLFGPAAGLAAAALAAVDPFLVYFGALELTECPALALLTFAALLAWMARTRDQRPGVGDEGLEAPSPAPGLQPTAPAVLAAAAGLLAAIGALTRPAVGTIGLLLVLGALALPGAGRPALRAALGRGLLALIVFCAAMSPWWIRNWRVLGAFVPMTTDGGASLYEGNSPRATGGPANPQTSAARTRELRLTDELERDRVLRREARRWIREHPAEFAKLALVKFARTWSPLPNHAPYRKWLYVAPSVLAWLVVMGLAAAAVVSCRLSVVGGPGRLEPAACCLQPAAVWYGLLPVLFVAAAHLVWIGSVRYRMPAWPFLEVLAGAGAAMIIGRLARGWRRRPG